MLTGAAASDEFGAAVGTAGDVNGDGFDDFMVGAHFGDAGRVYVYYGGTGVDAIPEFTFEGEAANDLFGNSVAAAGDVNGDAFDDLIVGAPYNDAAGLSAGRAYFYDFNRYHLVSPGGGDTWNVGAAESVIWWGAEPADVWLSVDGGGVLLIWETDPGPEDLMGYKVERALGTSNQWTVLSSLQRETSYLDQTGTDNNRYRLTGVNGLGEELLLGEAAFTPRAALSAWPLPYRGGDLQITFWTAGGVGAAAGAAHLVVYDLNGRLVRNLIQDQFEAGFQTTVWDGTNEHGVAVVNGVYFLRANNSGPSAQIKVVISR